MNTAPHVRDRELADLVCDLDLLAELFANVEPDNSDIVHLRACYCDFSLKVLQRAADVLHEMRGMGAAP